MAYCKPMAAVWWPQQEAKVRCCNLMEFSLINASSPEQPVIHEFTQHVFIERLLDTSPSARLRGDVKVD